MYYQAKARLFCHRGFRSRQGLLWFQGTCRYWQIWRNAIGASDTGTSYFEYQMTVLENENLIRNKTSMGCTSHSSPTLIYSFSYKASSLVNELRLYLPRNQWTGRLVLCVDVLYALNKWTTSALHLGLYGVQGHVCSLSVLRYNYWLHLASRE